MKPWSSIPVRLGGAIVGVLLLALGVCVLLVTRQMDSDAESIQGDSVPGLVQATLIRATCIEEFDALVEAGANSASRRSDFQAIVRSSDDRLRRTIEAYRETIHIDEPRDTALLNDVTRARGAYAAARTRWLQVKNDTASAGLSRSTDEVTRAFTALISKCDALVAYNAGTGTRFAGQMATLAAVLRWAAIALLLLLGYTVYLILNGVRREALSSRETRESLATLALAFRISPHMMVITRRRDGRIVAANEAFRRQYGVGNEDLSRYTALDVGVWESAEERAAALREYDPHGRITNYVKTRRQPDGTEHTVLISAERLTIHGEEHMLAVGQDISDRIRAERALARSEAELRTIVDNAAIGIALVDSAGHPIRANRALERFIGYSESELTGMSFVEFTHPDDVQNDVERFGKLINGEVDAYQIEKRYVRKDGATTWGRLTTSAVRGASRKLLYVVAMVEDITERKRAEAALRESEASRQVLQQQLIVAQKLEALGQLAGGVAHDFNNILAAITLHLDALKTEVAVSQPIRESIDELLRNARRAAGLTRQLLLFSRREPAQRDAVDLNVIVGHLLRMLERLIGRQYTLVHVADGSPVDSGRRRHDRAGGDESGDQCSRRDGRWRTDRNPDRPDAIG